MITKELYKPREERQKIEKIKQRMELYSLARQSASRG